QRHRSALEPRHGRGRQPRLMPATPDAATPSTATVDGSFAPPTGSPQRADNDSFARTSGRLNRSARWRAKKNGAFKAATSTAAMTVPLRIYHGHGPRTS